LIANNGENENAANRSIMLRRVTVFFIRVVFIEG